MAIFNWTSFNCILFTLLVSHAITAFSQAPVCSHVDCGQGTCFPSNASLLGFDCQCYPGWKKIEIGPWTIPSCVVPNCTHGVQCGNGSPPLPAPHIRNIPDPCLFIWCGEGTCVANGTEHFCKCDEGSGNLFKLPGAACIKKCAFRLDCNVAVVYRSATQAPPPENESGSTKAGSSDQVLNAVRLRLISMALLIGVFFI